VRSLEFPQIAQRLWYDNVRFESGLNVIERYLRFSAAFPQLHQAAVHDDSRDPRLEARFTAKSMNWRKAAQ